MTGVFRGGGASVTARTAEYSNKPEPEDMEPWKPYKQLDTGLDRSNIPHRLQQIHDSYPFPSQGSVYDQDMFRSITLL